MAHLLLGEIEQILAIEDHLAANDLAGWGRDEPHDRERCHALARSALADDAKCFTSIDVERDVVDRLHESILGFEVSLQVTNFK